MDLSFSEITDKRGSNPHAVEKTQDPRGINRDANQISCSHSGVFFRSPDRNDVWKVVYFCRAHFFVKSVQLWKYSDVHGHGDSLGSDRHRHLQGWQHHVRDRDPQRRKGDVQHFDAGSGHEFDYGRI